MYAMMSFEPVLTGFAVSAGCFNAPRQGCQDLLEQGEPLRFATPFEQLEHIGGQINLCVYHSAHRAYTSETVRPLTPLI